MSLMALRHGHVLGTRLGVTDYHEATAVVIDWAAKGEVRMVAAANTHLVAEAAAVPGYAQVLSSYDLVLPDGMPLVWALWLDGHELSERVYGPYFMCEVIEKTPAHLSHFFFGSSQACLDQLTAALILLNPRLQIAGTLSPPFSAWDEGLETSFINQINASGASFIWVALGGVKQETWIAKHQHRFERGVLCAVGDAFPLLAGMRSHAPQWMQRSGLTWLYRLLQEPRRLGGRYLKYNSRFLCLYLLDRWKKVHLQTESP